MKLIVNRLQFLKALQTAARACPSRASKEILRNVRMLAKDQCVVLTGTDTEITLRVEVPDVEGAESDSGECLLPTARLIQILTEMENDERFKMESVKGQLWIRGQTTEFMLLTEDPKDFPPIELPNMEDGYFKMLAPELRRMIKRTIFACDSESTRYALGGIQVEFNGTRVFFAATDSRRLAVDQGVYDVCGQPSSPAIPPVIQYKVMRLAAEIAEGTEQVQIAFTKNAIAIKSGNVMLTGQFVQGRFPDWRKVMPSRSQVSIDMPVGPFYGAVRQSMLISSEESRGVKFRLTKGTLQLSGEVADMGASKVELPIGYDGEKMEVVFDPRYIAELMKVLDNTQTVAFKLIDDEEPAMFEVGDYRCIVMPLSRDKVKS